MSVYIFPGISVSVESPKAVFYNTVVCVKYNFNPIVLHCKIYYWLEFSFDMIRVLYFYCQVIDRTVMYTCIRNELYLFAMLHV